ncbi:hypothetical protein SAMN04487948_103240 [Halogranum amylolyticum]|uniref:DUF7129 domain-containing protein n=1 Tax=Halogranum amylolyticum TaxID=660520 RepID=A0A1H8QQA2_9EURY|nr:rubrerythrin-like domain-containing protein [Halogranum amylolyticum]SEO56226.1 hypothetical protein SAMN04487948_103240 [Halogranum amylolyticum]
MSGVDPYDQNPPYLYECTNSGERVQAENRPGECSECGGYMQNISKPREQ